MLIAHAVTTFQQGTGVHNGHPGEAVYLTTEWVLGGGVSYSILKGERYIKNLKTNYFLVGVTERLNEFLVLLALHMGWDPAHLYYERCKPTDLGIHRSDFAKYFPILMPKLERSHKPAVEAWEWATKEFDAHVKQLGNWFQEVVREFETGLKKYQAAHAAPNRPYMWKMYHYLDRHTEYC